MVPVKDRYATSSYPPFPVCYPLPPRFLSPTHLVVLQMNHLVSYMNTSNLKRLRSVHTGGLEDKQLPGYGIRVPTSTMKILRSQSNHKVETIVEAPLKAEPCSALHDFMQGVTGKAIDIDSLLADGGLSFPVVRGGGCVPRDFVDESLEEIKIEGEPALVARSLRLLTCATAGSTWSDEQELAEDCDDAGHSALALSQLMFCCSISHINLLRSRRRRIPRSVTACQPVLASDEGGSQEGEAQVSGEEQERDE
eukprot:755744-Hanusia_phi.AAC.2